MSGGQEALLHFFSPKLFQLFLLCSVQKKFFLSFDSLFGFSSSFLPPPASCLRVFLHCRATPLLLFFREFPLSSGPSFTPEPESFHFMSEIENLKAFGKPSLFLFMAAACLDMEGDTGVVTVGCWRHPFCSCFPKSLISPLDVFSPFFLFLNGAIRSVF